MKRFATLVIVALASIQAHAAPKYVSCLKVETDVACANRIVLKSDALTGNFITVDSPERSMMFPAIFARKPLAAHVMSSQGDGGSVMTTMMVIYPVNASDVSGLQKAAFMVTIEKSYEDSAKAPKLVGRSIDINAITLVGGDFEN